MALLSDAVSIADLVLKLASGIQTLGDNFYKATAEWEEFPEKVDLLQQKVKFWEGQMVKFGMKSDQTLVKALEGAKAELEKELQQLRNRQNSGGNSGRCCFTVCRLTFPSHLGSSLKSVIERFDEIEKTITGEDAVASVLQKRAFGRCFSVPISKDNRYVPLKITESAVSEALEDAAGPRVVLLHGGPGRGKTSVANSMALRYKETHLFPDGIFFIKCGPEANPLDKQIDLLEMCQPESANLLQPGQPRKIGIEVRLRSLLKDTTRLIILDDVFESELLQSIVGFCGVNVKCLVTSQRADLCRNMDEQSSIPIKIEEIGVEDGRQIMASHLGFPNNQMPEHLNVYCDELIKATDFHPLAITTIAYEIPKQLNNDPDEWKIALKEMFLLLQSEEKVSMHGETYPRTFWKTMNSTIESLSPDARKVLFWTQAIKSPSIHEEVMKLIYQSEILGKNKIRFSKVKSELEGKGLLRIESEQHKDQTGSEDTYFDSSMYWMWYLHSLHKRFVGKEMDGQYFFSLVEIEIDSNYLKAIEDQSLDLLDHEDLDKVAVIAICAMFLEEPSALRFALKLHLTLGTLKKRQRSALDLILRLLCPINKGDDQVAKISATKVLISYICNGAFDEKATLTLLKMPLLNIPYMPQLMVYIIHDMISTMLDGDNGSNDWNPLWDKTTRKVLKVLASYFTEEKDPHMLSILSFCKQFMGDFQGAIGDLDNLQGAIGDIDKYLEDTTESNIYFFSLEVRMTSKAQIQDFQGALADADQVIEQRPNPYMFQERGILKRMMGDLPGALADLNESLEDDPTDYEVLKHRGYVKYLMQDHVGACADAESAIKFKHEKVDMPMYGRLPFLGCMSVDYLGYNLK